MFFRGTNDDYGAIIKVGRENHGLTQDQLAERLEVEPRSIQRWEAGTCIPWPSSIERLVALLPEIAVELRQAIKKTVLNIR